MLNHPPRISAQGAECEKMNNNMSTIMNENPQTAARLVALFAVLYSVTMAPLKAAAQAVGLTMKNPENGRKNATTTAQYREAVDRFLTLWNAEVAFRAPILPSLTGFGLNMWQYGKGKTGDSKRDTERLLARFALSPRGVGFAGLVNNKGFRPTRRTWAGQTVNWIRAAWADAANRCTASVEDRKANSIGDLEDGLRYCCRQCMKWVDNCGNVVAGSLGPMCCGQPTEAAYREGEQSARYEPFVMVYALVKGAWKIRRFAFKTNDGDNGGHIEANPYFGSHLVGRIAGNETFKRLFGKQHKTFKIMAAMMEDVDCQRWRVWVAVPVMLTASGAWVIDHIGAGMSKADALKMERTHALFANRDGFVEAVVDSINNRGTKAYTNKPQGSEASDRIALRQVK